MPRFHVLVAVALLLDTSAAVGAQELLTVDGAVQAALEHNASLRAARAEASAAAEQGTIARSAWFPRVTAGESWQRGDQPVFVFGSLLSARRFTAPDFAIDALNHPDTTGFFRTSVSVEQVIFDGGRTRAAVESASLGRTMASLAVDEAAASLVVAVTRTFGRILSAEASRRSAEGALDTAREDLRTAERRRDAGMATDADVLALMTHVADLRQRLIQSEGDAVIGRADLNHLMGAPIDREYGVAVPTETVPANAPLASLLEEAEQSRPELQRAALAGRLAAAARNSARSSLVPQVTAQARVEANGLRFGDRASAWTMGAEARWTLSLGGAELAQMRRAAADAMRVSAEADSALGAVHAEVVAARQGVESARARQAAGHAAAEQARESHRIVRDRFEAGMATVTDVLRSAEMRLDAELRQVAATVDAMVSRAMLDRAIGRAGPRVVQPRAE